MSKPAEIAALVKQTQQTFGALDILVNNAGIQHVAKIEEFPADKWDAVIAINLSSSFHTIKAALPGLIDQANAVVAKVPGLVKDLIGNGTIFPAIKPVPKG